LGKAVKHVDTKLIHPCEPAPRIGSVSMPVFQSAMFEYARETNYHDPKCIRLNNTPNHIGLYENLAALKVTEATLVASSGMAALSTALLSVPVNEVISDRVCHLGAANHLLSASEECCTLNSKALGSVARKSSK